MKKFISFINLSVIIIGMLVFVGCGHNIQSNTKGFGLNMSWQTDSYVPSIKLGYWDVTNAIVRGNTTYTTTTATGGSLFNSSGTQTTTQMFTGLQLNQGNLVQILTSKENSNQVKIALLKAITKLKSIQPTPTVAKTVVAAGGTGEKLPKIKPITTNTDKIIQVANQAASQVAKSSIPTTENTYKSYIFNIKEILIKILSYIKIIILPIIIFIIGIFIYKKYKKKIIN